MKLGRSKSPPARHRQLTPDQPKTDSVNLARLNQPSEPTRRLRYYSQRLLGLILFIVILVSAANILSLSTFARVQSTSTDNTFLRPLSVYTAAANSYLSHSVWNKNKITISGSSLSANLKKQFPELSQVSLVVPLIVHTPVIYVQAYQPALILRSISGQYAVNSQGLALLKVNDHLPPTLAKLPVVTEENNQTIKLNQPAIASTAVSFIYTVATQLKAKGYNPSSLQLPAAASELDVLINNQPYVAKFNLESSDPKGQVGTLLATLNYLKQHNTTPAQYIDVRLAGRAYYK